MARRSPLGPGQRRDLLVGLALLALGIVWTGIVLATVPPGNFGVGPRAFPLWLGIGLVVLSVIMAATAWLGRDGRTEPESGRLPGSGWSLFRTAATVCLIIGAYGLLMQGLGFVIGTILTVAFTLWIVLGVHRPVLVAGMAVGIAMGSWLIFSQILGAYLPPGTWLPF